MDASDWMKGIFFSVLASVIGAASKLAIRKGWLMETDDTNTPNRRNNGQHESIPTTPSRARQGGGAGGSNPYTWQDELDDDDGVEDNDSPQNLNCNATGNASTGNNSNSQAGNPNEPLDEQEQEHAHNREQGGAGEDKPNTSSRRHLLYTAVEPSDLDSSISSIFRDDDDNHSLEGGAAGQQHMEMEQHPSQQSTTGTPTTTPNGQCLFWKYSQLLRFAGMIGMTFLNPACSLVAMNYASPSILSPFSGLTLVWVIVLSRPLIGENPSCAQKVACSFIVLGEIMVAVFGDHTNDDGASIASVRASYKESPFIGYFIGLTIWMLLLAYWIRHGTSQLLKRFAWGTSGGSMTGLAQCFIKDSLVVLKAAPNKLWMPWFEYLFIIMGIACSFGGLLFLSACMKRYDATYSAAMFVGSFVVSTSIMSALHYHTFEHLADWTDWIMYPLGIIILMIGVAILVQRGTQHGTSTEDNGMMPPLPEPRTNRAYSDVMHQADIPHEYDDTPVMMIPEPIHENNTTTGTLTERSNCTSRTNSRDELELI